LQAPPAVQDELEQRLRSAEHSRRAKHRSGQHHRRAPLPNGGSLGAGRQNARGEGDDDLAEVVREAGQVHAEVLRAVELLVMGSA
jgi:hypothetical protein